MYAFIGFLPLSFKKEWLIHKVLCSETLTIPFKDITMKSLGRAKLQSFFYIC